MREGGHLDSPQGGVGPCDHSENMLAADPVASQVLVVDDDPSTRRLLEKLLSSAGYEVVTAQNGVEAIRILMDKGVQIVVSDWIMPAMDGLELCRAIRSSETVGFVYLIMVTVHQDKQRLLEAFAAGADDFLSKPFDRQELLVRVRAGARIVRLEADLAKRNREIFKHNAEMAMLNSKLERLATTDALTGLLNRRQGMVKLQELWEMSERYEIPFAGIVFDIDQFKRFNDTHGHAVGDLVLQCTAQAARAAVRTVDVVTRVGGEEFAVWCPNTRVDEAVVLAERLRCAIETNLVEHEAARLHVTVSSGVAERGPRATTIDAFLKEADDALYDAKESGRNCVCVAASASVSRPVCEMAGD